MYLYNPFFEINGSLVPVGTEILTSHSEDIGFTCLRLHTQVIIACIVPTAYVQSRNKIARLIFAQSRRSLAISVNVIDIRLGHSGIVLVAEVMPYTILLVDTHVTHLYW